MACRRERSFSPEYAMCGFKRKQFILFYFLFPKHDSVHIKYIKYGSYLTILTIEARLNLLTSQPSFFFFFRITPGNFQVELDKKK